MAGTRLRKGCTLRDKPGDLPSRPAMTTLGAAVEARLAAMEEAETIGRIWRGDHTVWKQDPTEIADRLGWLHLPERMQSEVASLEAFAAKAAGDGFTQALLLGMGGSSLAPEVLRAILGAAPGMLDLRVLDSTHPEAIARTEAALDPRRTLFVVASKSGGTIETLSHLEYFWEKSGEGRRFVAITDPGSDLETIARERGFRGVFLNPTDVGGRYSALSMFGLVPAALIGADLTALLDPARDMALACGPATPIAENPGAWLGALLGEAARGGRDKLTLVLPHESASFGVWIEQLVAESTGKEGVGILPVHGEALGPPDFYGADRLFVVVGESDGRVEALEDAGHPVARLPDGPLGGDFFVWEFATAIAGAVLEINPFDQPNVAEAKAATAEILGEPDRLAEGYDDFAPLLGRLRPGDYVAIQAFVDPTPGNEALLERARIAVRNRYRVATTLGMGPRYLHSTGQLHKGGPDDGVFLQVVDRDRKLDLAIPGKPFSFGALIDAQADGDLRSLRARGRRVARVTLDDLEEVS